MKLFTRKLVWKILPFFQSFVLLRRVGKRIFQGVVITEATEQDLVYVHSQLNPGASSGASVLNPGVTNLIASWHGSILGFVKLVRHPPSDTPFIGYWLFSLTTLRLYFRGLGIGERLSDAVFAIARKEGADEIFLIVDLENKAAVSLYNKLGFSQVTLPGLEERLADEGKITGKHRIIMKKRLS